MDNKKVNNYSKSELTTEEEKETATCELSAAENIIDKIKLFSWKLIIFPTNFFYSVTPKTIGNI